MKAIVDIPELPTAPHLLILYLLKKINIFRRNHFFEHVYFKKWKISQSKTTVFNSIHLLVYLVFQNSFIPYSRINKDHLSFLSSFSHFEITYWSLVTFFSFCVLKKNEYTIKSVSVAARPAVRLHDNFRKETPIDLKFSAEFNRINISVEFEDGPDPSKIS